MKKLMKFIINTWNGIPENLKDTNDDGNDWWVTQIHFLPFIMYQLCNDHKIIFGWLFWSVSIRWPRKQS